MARTSPFADVNDGPAADAVVVELGRPTRVALGCFALTTLFLGVIAGAAVSYAAFGVPGPRTAVAMPRVLAGVLGGIMLLIVLGLALVVLRANRGRHGLALDGDAAWWRSERVLVRLPWSDIAVARVVPPEKIRGIRTSTPSTPAVELCPVDEPTLRRYPQLTDLVTAGEPIRPELPALRFTFRLSSAQDEASVAEALARFAAEQWAGGRAN